jgi:hypothetical protein
MIQRHLASIVPSRRTRHQDGRRAEDETQGGLNDRDRSEVEKVALFREPLGCSLSCPLPELLSDRIVGSGGVLRIPLEGRREQAPGRSSTRKPGRSR